MNTKSKCREEIRGRLSRIPDKDLKDREIAKNLIPLLLPFSKIVLYSALSDEPELSILPKVLKSIRFFYPRINQVDRLEFIYPERFVRGKFGIWEPEGIESDPPSTFDRILLPALGYAGTGHRLGRGRGYYDRALQGIPPESLIGVAYSDFHSLEFIPEAHDLRVGTVVTETGSFFLLDENKSPDII